MVCWFHQNMINLPQELLIECIGYLPLEEVPWITTTFKYFREAYVKWLNMRLSEIKETNLENVIMNYAKDITRIAFMGYQQFKPCDPTRINILAMLEGGLRWLVNLSERNGSIVQGSIHEKDGDYFYPEEDYDDIILSLEREGHFDLVSKIGFNIDDGYICCDACIKMGDLEWLKSALDDFYSVDPCHLAITAIDEEQMEILEWLVIHMGASSDEVIEFAVANGSLDMVMFLVEGIQVDGFKLGKWVELAHTYDIRRYLSFLDVQEEDYDF